MVSRLEKSPSNKRRSKQSEGEEQQLCSVNSMIAKSESDSKPNIQKPKRPHEVEELFDDAAIEPLTKKACASVDSVTAAPASSEIRLDTISGAINHWRSEGTWPKEYLESDVMDHLLAKKRSTPLRRKRSEPSSLAASSITPSDQKPRHEKSAPYQDPRYKVMLEIKRSFMEEDKEGPKTESKDLCRSLLRQEQDVPQTSRFSEGIFKSSCSRIDGKNEAKIIQDITRLIVPSAEELADFGAQKLECLVEAVNEGWNNSIPVTKTRPQPDYSVGFTREAFSEGQQEKLAPFIGDFIAGDQSYFMATYYMYFPFLTCEVKCGAAALDIADRQNAHSMTLAVRAVVELFRLAKREKEIHREILAFSISHDHRSVRIYGHYAVIDESNTTFYRHSIRDFSFQELDGKEKWTTYKFVKSVYNTWMPTHLKRLCSAIDDLPSGVSFDVPPLQQDSGLPQDLSSHHRSESFMGSVVHTEDDRSHSGTMVTTPDTSFIEQGVSKKQKRKKAK